MRTVKQIENHLYTLEQKLADLARSGDKQKWYALKGKILKVQEELKRAKYYEFLAR